MDERSRNRAPLRRTRRMSPGTLGIILIAAASHATWNIASKRKRGDTYLFVWEYTSLSALLCLPFVVVAVATGDGWSWTLVLAAAGSAVFHLLYSLVLQFGYEHSDLSVVYPVARGFGPLLTLIIAIAVLGQRPGVVAVVGAVIVIVGILVVIGNPFGAAARAHPGALLWGAATGVLIAVYTLWDNYSITSLNLHPTTYFALTLVCETLALTPGAMRRRAEMRRSITLNWREIIVIAILSPLAYILILIALQTVPVAIVAPLRESSIVIGALLAWWLFHEQHLAKRIIGAVVVLAGIALISFG